MENLFEDYILLTKSILSGIKNGISIDEFFERRENLINSIIADNSLSKEEKKTAYEASGAKELDKQVVEFIKDEMIKTKEEMRSNANNKRLYSSYVTNNMKGSFFRRII